MSYAAVIWHNLVETPKGVAAALQPIQNKCLRIVSGAYKATPVRDLETKTYIPPLDLYLDERKAAYSERIKGTQAEQVIQKSCI
jgi:hypothetical protein